MSLKGNKLGGYAAVFEQRTEIMPGWSEEFAVGSFDDIIKQEQDTRALFNHDPNFLLGRTASGTLRLSADDNGLEYELDLPDTSFARDLHVLAERGDLSGASISFIPGDMEVLDQGAVDRHTRVDSLYDISPVTYPAYQGTSTEARSHGLARYRAQAILLRHKGRMI